MLRAAEHKGLPADVDAEKAVLFKAMRSNAETREAIELLTAADFSNIPNQRTFAAIKATFEKYGESSLPTVVNEMSRTNTLALVGGRSYLASLGTPYDDVCEIAAYIRIVLEKSRLRRIITGAHSIASNAIVDEDLHEAEAQAERLAQVVSDRRKAAPPVLNVADLLSLDIPEASMLIEGIIPAAGASLIVGAAKSGKTLNAVQMGIAVASGAPLYGFYEVLKPGPVLIIEQDDPAGIASIKTILQRSAVPVVVDIPFHVVANIPYQFGADFQKWLESEIVRLGIRFAAIDSYTALRGARQKGGDIVKAEQSDLTQLDALAKRTDCALAIIHHSSKGSAGLDWSEKAAGTFAMSAATESQLFISRFPELDGAAPERLVRVRGRHSEDLELVLKFRKESLDFERVIEGGAAALYPFVLQLRTAFGRRAFSPKDLTHATGLSIATAHRQLNRLYRAGAVQKRGFGEYTLVEL